MPRTSGRRALRRVLVAGQFTISLVLMIMTGIVASQLGYAQRKDLGFRTGDILEIPIAGTPLAKSYAAFRDELRSSSGVLGVSAAMGSPLRGRLAEPVKLGSEEVEVQHYPVDEDYLDTLGMTLVRGRNFARSFPSDASAAVIVNESAVRAFGLDDPIGRPFKKIRGEGKIIGVVRDFHSASLREPVSPAVLEISPSFYRSVLVRVSPRNISTTLDIIGRIWQKFAPQHPFSYGFLDDAYRRLYQSEGRFLKVFLGFSGLALLIAGLGLYGLASLAVVQRTKEIGIRKALGASISKVVVLFSGEFLRLILLAGIAASPIAWSFARAWLRSFAFRIEISPWFFIGSTALAIGVGILTVGAQSIRAASVDPSQTLKYE
jgi:putative ABC transport system permease protein